MTVLRIIFLVFLVACSNAAEKAQPPTQSSGQSSTKSSGDSLRGEKIYKERGCSACHSIEWVGGVIGPDLTQVTLRRTDEWLRNWLKDPPSVLKDTVMPKVPWRSEQEISDLIEFFKTFKSEVKKDFLGKVPKKDAGKMLVKEYGCSACHRIVGPASGRVRFPDLTHVAKKRDRKWLNDWLKDPQKVKPGTFMPTYPLTDIEREAIVEYLSTLR